jgi:hypothetical protein
MQALYADVTWTGHVLNFVQSVKFKFLWMILSSISYRVSQDLRIWVSVTGPHRVSVTGPHTIGNSESEMFCMHGTDLQCYLC